MVDCDSKNGHGLRIENRVYYVFDGGIFTQ